MIKTPLSTMIGGAGIWTPGCTVIGSMQKTLDQLIKSMFANNEQGFTRTPDDLSTMYQDAAGMSAVSSPAQPLGLMLDKSKGLALGEEIFLNSEFNAQGGWDLPPNVSINNGALKFTEASAARARYTVNTKAATWYLFSIDITSNLSGFLGLRVGGVLLSGYVGNTGRLQVFYLSATAGVVAFDIVCSIAATTAEVNSASLKEIKGNHAYQTTSAARPLFKQVPILGSELIPTLDFTVAWKGLPATTTVSAKSFTTTEMGGVSLGLPLDTNKQYQVTLNYTINDPAVTVQIISGVSGAGTMVSTGTSLTRSVIMSGGNPSGLLGIYLRAMSAATVTVNSVSLKEITGYRTDQNYIEYDKVDDKLLTTFAAPLTNCTVVRAVPNVGTKILTGQTIPATYEDNKDHCGLIVINRALTTAETAQITQIFNKAAGV